MAAWGFTDEDLATERVDVWPENELSYRVFASMSTQWRMGYGGPVGLDFGVLGEMWQRLKVPMADRDVVFMDLQVMETAALEKMSENNSSDD